MSRSFRKTPVVSEQQVGGKRIRDAKRAANKAVRMSDEVPNGKAYRKFSCSWEICDYKSYWHKAPAESRRK